MAELGDYEAEGHAAIAERARELGIELYAIGTQHYGCQPIDLDQALALSQRSGPGRCRIWLRPAAPMGWKNSRKRCRDSMP